jgi:ketosteroid isomerase-like protein
MKTLSCALLLLLAACDSQQGADAAKQDREDVQAVESQIHAYCSGLRRAYQGTSVNTDSLVDAHFDPAVYYVTYWGTTEPIDTTKSRLKRALPLMKGYENRVEIMRTKVYGDAAVSFFILRQSYTLNGNAMDEYLPTTYVFERRDEGWKIVHAHRSADLETTGRLFEIAKNQQK